MKLYLIRHGQTNWNLQRKIQGTTDIPLNETGIAQAHEVGRKLLELKDKYTIDTIFCSHLQRAHKTAEIIASYLNVPCAPAEGLHELNLGAFEGKTWDEGRAEFPEAYDAWYSNRRYAPAPGGGESYQASYERCAAAIRREAAKLPRDTRGMAVVSHGGTIFATIAAITNTDFEDMGKYVIGNLSVTVVDYDPDTDTWKFESVDAIVEGGNNSTAPR